MEPKFRTAISSRGPMMLEPVPDPVFPSRSMFVPSGPETPGGRWAASENRRKLEAARDKLARARAGLASRQRELAAMTGGVAPSGRARGPLMLALAGENISRNVVAEAEAELADLERAIARLEHQTGPVLNPPRNEGGSPAAQTVPPPKRGPGRPKKDGSAGAGAPAASGGGEPGAERPEGA